MCNYSIKLFIKEFSHVLDKAGLGLLHCGLHGVLVSHVHGRNQHRYIGHLLAQRFGLGLQGALRAATQREATARLGQLQRDGCADARACAGDEGVATL